MRLFAIDAFRFLKRLIKEIGAHDLGGAAAELAYRLFLALFPFCIFLAAMGGFIASVFGLENPTRSIMNLIGDSLPPDAASVIQGEVENVISSRDVALISVGFVGAIWAASSGVGTVMKTMNRIYGVRETRALWKRYLLAVGVTLLGGTALIGSFMLVVIGQVYGQKIADDVGLGGPTATLFTFARLPLGLLFTLAAVAFLYWSAPNLKLPFKWITPGSVFFTLGWLLLTYLFGVYVGHFGSYDATYGTLGGVVVLMVWIYFTGFLLLIGGQINAVLVEENAPETLPKRTENSATPPEIIAIEREHEAREAEKARDNAISQPVGLLPLVTGAALALITWRPRRSRRDHDSRPA